MDVLKLTQLLSDAQDSCLAFCQVDPERLGEYLGSITQVVVFPLWAMISHILKRTRWR